jgi:enamine deaminase RidA (YjgF/YER057c/UK114 family)
MVERVQLTPDWPWAKDVGIAQGVRVGGRIYVSGQVALDGDGAVVGVGDMAAQARQTFANIRAVLAEGGASMDDVVKITAYITDMSRYAEYAAARAEAFGGGALPASATVTTPALVMPDLLVEIEAIAELG